MKNGSTQLMQKLAQLRGGKCLSPYIDASSKLSWQCSQGHQWEATPRNIQNGLWCPACRKGSFVKWERNTIELMRKVAEERGGKCLSARYINAHDKLTWQCSEGHEWEAVPNNIKNGGTWCPACAGVQKGTIEKMHKLAEKRGGKCLSARYINAQDKLTWQCSEGHEWEAAPHTIHEGHWCPVCAGVLRDTIEEMQKFAEERGGKCLSARYINAGDKLTWQCKKGHEWDSSAYNIVRGRWCPACAGCQKGTIEEMHKLAEERGGKCLSGRYINAWSKLRWQCKEGHQWKARPTRIKNNGRWCPTCHGTRKNTIEQMQQLAKERGGKCLSTTYVNAQTKLLWECEDGHQWYARPVNIKNMGQWCPGCSGRWGSSG